MAAQEDSADRAMRRRPWGRIVLALVALLGIVLSFGPGFPRMPANGPAIIVPDDIVLTLEDGSEVRLQSYRLADGPQRFGFISQYVDLGELTLSEIDETSYVEAPIEIRYRDALSRTRFVITERRADGEERILDRAEDLRLLYRAMDEGLPVEEDGSAFLGGGEVLLTVEVDDSAVVAISPSVLSPDHVPESLWEVWFDFAAMQEQGRTNLDHPVSWYGSPVFGILRVAGVVLAAAALIAVLVLGARQRRRQHREDIAWMGSRSRS